MHDIRVVQVIVKGLEDIPLGSEHLAVGIRAIRQGDQVLGCRRCGLFNLGSDEETGNPNELVLGERADPDRHEAVKEVGAKMEGFGE